MRSVTELDKQIARDRLRGNGAWNGQGLLVHLALTSEGDSARVWMEPLAELCKRVDASSELELTDTEEHIFDELAVYAQEFQAALES